MAATVWSHGGACIGPVRLGQVTMANYFVHPYYLGEYHSWLGLEKEFFLLKGTNLHIIRTLNI
jgi:hypothetical protein